MAETKNISSIKYDPKDVIEHYHRCRNLRQTGKAFRLSPAMVHRIVHNTVKAEAPLVDTDPRIAKIQTVLDRHAALQLYGFECIMEIRNIMKEK